MPRLLPRLAVLLLAAAACREPAKPAQPAPPSPQAPSAEAETALPELAPRDYEKPVRELYKDEPDYERRWPVEYRVRVVEGLTQDLQRAAQDLGAFMGAPYFAPKATFALSQEVPASETKLATVTFRKHEPLPAAERSAEEIRAAWRAWFAPFAFVERAVFKPKQATLTEDGGLEAAISIELGGKEKSGGWRRDVGVASARFAGREGGWRLRSFVIKELTTQRAPEKFFEDVTEAWLSGVSPELRERLRRRSASDELHARLLDDANPLPSTLNHLEPVAMDAHPGAVVVDINGDRFDDLFVWDVRGEAVLLENQRGQGFADRTAQYGLTVKDLSSAAFADLDGDGALDVVLGRWYGPSEIWFGFRGRFYPGNASRYGALPANVVSISVADVNRDGRLDLFLSTAAHDFHGHLAAVMEGGAAVLDLLPPGERPLLLAALPAAKQAKAAGRFDVNLFQFGPANALLLNRGEGRFEDATARSGLTLFRNTLQAAFADVNADGWPDLFLANDFAPANLYVNQRGLFVDQSAANGAEEIFFGMGASFGDFDNDGDLDLYASAMQSSAGNRIMSDEKNFADELDATSRRLRKEAARGNTLLRNDGKGRFADASAGPPFANLRGGQWAYSSQFIDVDGDAFLDLFVPNGFFTSPVGVDVSTVRDL